jgi:hypothetical protein
MPEDELNHLNKKLSLNSKLKTSSSYFPVSLGAPGFIFYLTPLIPLSFKGEGEGIRREVSPLFDSP